MILPAAGAQLLQHSGCMLPASRIWRSSRVLSSLCPPQRCTTAISQARGDLPDVQRLAELAQIEVTPQEVTCRMTGGLRYML